MIVLPEVIVIVFGALIVKSPLNVSLFIKLTAPVPPPVTEILLNVFPPPLNVFELDVASEIIIVDELAVTVIPVVEVSQTVPVPATVQFPEPIVIARVLEVAEVSFNTVMLKPFASRVP